MSDMEPDIRPKVFGYIVDVIVEGLGPCCCVNVASGHAFLSCVQVDIFCDIFWLFRRISLCVHLPAGVYSQTL